ncbi:MAG: YceI family protein [Chloroflexi bacterium]|nr:YceI family protein [Chloroflexota bacterium]
MNDTGSAAASRTFNGTLFPLPGVYNLDPAHTFAEFTAQHLVVGHVRGRFDRTTGEVTIAEDPTLSSLTISIETASVSTHNAKRDEDLRGPRFFDVEKFPIMTFHSTAVIPELDGNWTVQGELTVRDVTLPVSLTVAITGVILDSKGNVRAGIRAHVQVSRRDFGLLADLEQETGGSKYGRDVYINVDTEILLQEGA